MALPSPVERVGGNRGAAEAHPTGTCGGSGRVGGLSAHAFKQSVISGHPAASAFCSSACSDENSGSPT
jgi:hypothetical protein